MTLPEVIGIDPSLKATGLCFPDGSTQVIRTGDADRGDARLWDLSRQLRYYLRSWPAQLAVIEIPGQFRSGDAAMAAGMVQGIIRTMLIEFRLPFGKIHLTKLKMFATGHGGGGETDKAHMIAAANRHRERFAVPITDDNEADAWWLRQMGLWHLGVRDLDPACDASLIPNTIRDAVVNDSKGVRWPGR
jgi:Holliday junction resolvasome RuvABC endonuclease subunit